jgi:hypothetical protein
MNILDLLKAKNEMSERRLSICKECEHLNQKLVQCKKCGCFMHAKVKFHSSSCPIGKWGAEEEEINT